MTQVYTFDIPVAVIKRWWSCLWLRTSPNQFSCTQFSAARYVDDLDTPYGFPGTSPQVPLAYKVANTVFTTNKWDKKNDENLSVLFMVFGQILTHDIAKLRPGACPPSL